jgi:protein TonB
LSNPFADWNPSALEWALMLSALVHAVAIGGLGFVKPDPKRTPDKLPVLEVVLVNSKTKAAPTKAEALAQSNLDRGGNVDENRRMKSPLPVPKNHPKEQIVKPSVEQQQARNRVTSEQEELPRKQQRKAEQEKQAQEVLTQAHAKQVVENERSQRKTEEEPAPGQQEEPAKALNTADMVARSLDAARLEAQLSKNMEIYQKRPKRKFFGARVREYRFASYVEAWRQKVERVGNLNYPAAAKEQQLYGQLRMTVAILADGTVEKVELNQSSGHKLLDEAARRIVELAGPYAPFPPDVQADTDIIEITRTWTFTREDKLSGE